MAQFATPSGTGQPQRPPRFPVRNAPAPSAADTIKQGRLDNGFVRVVSDNRR